MRAIVVNSSILYRAWLPGVPVLVGKATEKSKQLNIRNRTRDCVVGITGATEDSTGKTDD